MRLDSESTEMILIESARWLMTRTYTGMEFHAGRYAAQVGRR